MIRPTTQCPLTAAPAHHAAGNGTLRLRQTGLTLVEMMVAMFLGLLIVGMALGAILMSRNLAATTTDVSALQQQAAYAFRILGTHIRQAGSPELDLGLQSDPVDRVELIYRYDSIDQALFGTDDPQSSDYLKVGHSNYEETIFDPTAPAGPPINGHLLRDCLGEETTDTLVHNSFRWVPPGGNRTTGRLVCQGNGSSAQEIIRNVSDFRVHYLQQSEATGFQPKIERVEAPDITSALDWSRIVAVEVCLDMVGDERIDIPDIDDDNYKYVDCDGQKTSYGNRTHMVFRNIFQIRSQGVALDHG